MECISNFQDNESIRIDSSNKTQTDYNRLKNGWGIQISPANSRKDPLAYVVFK